MEHLFDEEDLEVLGFNLPKTPWLGYDHDTTQCYDVVDFETYPLLRGWARDELYRLRTGALSRSNLDALSMLQSWFTFGFLEATFRQRFHTADFVSRDQLFHTSFLRPFIKQRARELHGMPEEEALQILGTLDDAQQTVYEWAVMIELQTNKTSQDLRLEQVAPTMRLCTLIGEAIRHFQVISSAACPSWLEKEGPGWCYSDLNQELLTGQLVEKGWCPSTFGILFNTSHSAIELAALVEAKDKKSGRHQDCTEKSCVAYNVLQETYETAHVDSSCACNFMAPPFDRLAALIRQGEVPVLNLDALLDGPDEEPVHSLDGQDYVVAFSHVWSDGLGSHAEQGLPRCQVTRLRNLVARTNAMSDTPRPSLAWIDSMCIPRQKDLRHAAIRTMASVYRMAWKTIVLDSSLQNFDPDRRPAQELAVRVLCSTWMKRLWTLQEGALAKRLYFVLGGHAIAPASWLVNLAYSNPHCQITWDFGQTLVRMGVGTQHKPMNLAAVLRLLPFRSTSNADDETLALAPIMGLDVATLLKEYNEERMKAFWLLLRQVPLATLFIPGERLRIPGFRWAPRSFIRESTTVEIFGEAAATVSEQGLLAEYLVVIFDNPLRIDSQPIHHIRFSYNAKDPAGQDQHSTIFGESRLDQTSLKIQSDFKMILMATTKEAKVSNVPCVGLVLPDRFYPEAMVVLLADEESRSIQDSIAIPSRAYQYAGAGIMVRAKDSSPASTSGKLSSMNVRLT